MEMIERAERLGWILLGVSVVIAVVTSVVTRQREVRGNPMVWLGMLLCSHPGWWMSARGGDCGMTRVFTSWASTGMVAAAAIFFIVRARRRAAKVASKPGGSSGLPPERSSPD